MLKKLIIVSVALAAAGCAGVKTVPLSEDAVPMIEGRNLSGAFAAEKPNFVAHTPGKAMLGIAGAFVAISEGNKIVNENNVKDPAVDIYNALAKELAEAHQMVPLDDNTVATTDSDLEAILGKVNDGRLLLDVRTLNWNLVNFAMSFGKYKVNYMARMRLIDSASREVVAESLCTKATPESGDTAPTYDELLANRAERLKQELKIATDYCISDFKTSTLRL